MTVLSLANRWRVDRVLQYNENATVGEGIDVKHSPRRVVVKRLNSARKARRELRTLLEIGACDPTLVSTAASHRLVEDFEVFFPTEHDRDSSASPDHPSTVMMLHPGSTRPVAKWTSVRGDAAAAKVLFPAMRCVEEIHSKTLIVHMDVKPNNFVDVSSDGELKYALVDFGLSRHVGEEDPGGRGTPVYMSPEALCRQRFLASPELDAWALGIMLYQATNGHLHPYKIASPGILSEGCGHFVRAACLQKYDAATMWINEGAPLAKDLCSMLLHHSPSERMPVAEAVHHPLFHSVPHHR
nr:protein kinase [Oceanusvirus sp.]